MTQDTSQLPIELNFVSSSEPKIEIGANLKPCGRAGPCRELLVPRTVPQSSPIDPISSRWKLKVKQQLLHSLYY